MPGFQFRRNPVDSGTVKNREMLIRSWSRRFLILSAQIAETHGLHSNRLSITTALPLFHWPFILFLYRKFFSPLFSGRFLFDFEITKYPQINFDGFEGFFFFFFLNLQSVALLNKFPYCVACSYHDNAYLSSRALHIVNELNASSTYKLLEAFFQNQVGQWKNWLIFSPVLRLCEGIPF